MTTPPTAALFDIGNVLVHLDFENALSTLVPSGAEDPGTRIRSLLERKDEFESGALSDRDFIAWASERLGYTGSAENFRRTWNSIFEPIPAMWGVASFLKSQRLKIVLFSNTNSMHAEWLLANHHIFDEFDGRVFSHEVGAIKPDPAIYHYAIKAHGLNPADTLYLDDLPENIATGRELGFRCHQYSFSRHHEFVEWLDQQLGVG
ncbi:MAG: HAD family phosphatase [Akkermansiaceae bacterium]|nr:HAD family phosphatase [Akkermansiaceae bacterium]